MLRLRIGVAGLGRAFRLMSPAFADPRVELVAAADLRNPGFKGRFVESVEALCRDPGVDVVYVATPHQLHAEHACLAARHGKHVLVEKPMALTLEDCARMVNAARTAGVALVVGPSHGFDAPILQARELIASGRHGSLRMMTALNFTDFLTRRPRDALDTVFVNQAPHQVDLVRMLSPGEVVSVRAHGGEAGYSALLGFDDGAFASLNYSGRGHFDSDELMGGIGEMGDAGHHPHFGFVVASCERADLRPTPEGVMIYGEGEARLDALPPHAAPRVEVINELYDAVAHGKAPLHSGTWGMTTLEVCLAITESSRSGKEIALGNRPKNA
ncbi:MAG TPA: Gfo/Idh/MocA family oxidoreductase [Burkholderiales bacterium]|nr:Gfo/Idh/MocA family oxidoreductase [Burkholderiales bacterium]